MILCANGFTTNPFEPSRGHQSVLMNQKNDEEPLTAPVYNPTFADFVYKMDRQKGAIRWV